MPQNSSRYEVNTLCRSCDHKFNQGSLVLGENGWICPSCGGSDIKPIIYRPPYKWSEARVKYKEGPHD